MASKIFAENSSQSLLEGASALECAICLQTCVHPCELPCGHIFCFLCVKGVALQSKKCAMCRHEIPHDYLEKPRLLPCNQLDENFEGGYQWFYEGSNGWWQYDPRTSKELEASYKRGERTCDLLIAGLLYVADFDAMLQLRRNEPGRRRRIKRDLVTIPKKGVAGLRLTDSNTNSLPAEISEQPPEEEIIEIVSEFRPPPPREVSSRQPNSELGGNTRRRRSSRQRSYSLTSELHSSYESIVENNDSIEIIAICDSPPLPPEPPASSPIERDLDGK